MTGHGEGSCGAEAPMFTFGFLHGEGASGLLPEAGLSTDSQEMLVFHSLAQASGGFPASPTNSFSRNSFENELLQCGNIHFYLPRRLYPELNLIPD